MNYIKAYSNENAVKVIAFAINFSEKITDVKVHELINQIKSNEYFKKNFSKFEDQTQFSLVFGPDGAQQQTVTVNGIILYENQLLWSLTFNSDVILITCKKYNRWKEISIGAYAHLEHLIRIIDSGINISQVTLEYLDEFEILNPSERWKNELFNFSCKYLNPNLYTLTDFWHLNQGYFIKLEGLENKLLDTININYFADQNDSFKHKLNIRTQHKLLVEPVKPISDFNYIKDCFEKMHIHSKEIFESIVHNNVLNTFARRKN